MGFDDLLRSARTGPAVAFDNFIRKYKIPGYLHVFFEGYDDSSFYTGFIERYVDPKRIHQPYICDGKSYVYETYEKVKKRLALEKEIAKKIRTLFLSIKI